MGTPDVVMAAEHPGEQRVVALIARGPIGRSRGTPASCSSISARVRPCHSPALRSRSRGSSRTSTPWPRARASANDLGGAPRTDEVGRPDRVDGIDARCGFGGLLLTQRQTAEGRPAPASARRRSTWTPRGAPRASGWPGEPSGSASRSSGVSTRRNPSARWPAGSPAARRGHAPRPDALFGARGVGHLARVAEQRLDLAVERCR